MVANDQSGSGGEEQVSNDVQVGGKDIQMVSDGEVESVLGWTVIYTIGPVFTVDRAWLEDRAEELGIPESVLPKEVTPKRAHTRTAMRLSQDDWGITPPGVELNAERADDDNNVFHVEMTDRRDGMNGEVIGDFIYDDEEVVTQAKTSDQEYIEWFMDLSEWLNEMYQTQLRSNMGKDIRKMIRGFCKEDTTSVKMRSAGAVYFVPAQYHDTLSKLKTLTADINQHWKDMGHETGIDTIEVIDSPSKREMVEKKVRAALTETVEGIVDDALDAFDEETAAEQVVSELGKELAQAENLAVEHNTLLNAEISVKEALEQWKTQVTQDKEELVEELVESVDV